MKKQYLGLALVLLTGCSFSKPNILTEDITRKALSLNDSSICSALQDKKNQEFCLATLRDAQKISEAESLGNIQVCSEISNKEAEKACELAATSRQRKLAEEKKEKDQLVSIQSGNSIDDCKRLTMASFRDQCIINVASKMALEQKNPDLCKDIEESEVRGICESFAKNAQ